jgi:hypothetical protein
MKKIASAFVIAVIISHTCFSQSISTVSPSSADVGQGLEVAISFSNIGQFFCPQLQSWRVCDTVKRAYFRKGDSIRNVYGISGTTYPDSAAIVVWAGFPLSSPIGAWDLVIEHKTADSLGDSIQKLVKTNGFTLNGLSSPVVDSVRPAVVYQNRKVVVDIFATHTHFIFARPDSLVNNITNLRLNRDATSIKADSFSIQSSTKLLAYFTLKNSADTGLFNLTIDQGSGLPAAVLQKGFSIKPAPTSTYSLPDGCIGFYPFEGDASDLSYSGNNGAPSNAIFVDGIYGQALYFNGKNSSVTIPNRTTLNVSDGLTISAWVKPEFDSLTATTFCITRKGYYNWQLSVDLFNGVTFMLMKNGSNYGYTPNYENSHTNEWIHVVGTWDGSVMRTYVNGVMQSNTTQLPSPIDNSEDDLVIGKEGDFGGYFKGIIDEVMIFNRGLRAGEVDSIYKGIYLGNLQNNLLPPVLIPYTPKVSLDPRPKFAWHPTPGNTSYTLSAATNASFSNIIFQIPLADTAFCPSVNMPVGPIFWHVKSNLSLQWSAPDNFVIQSDTVPFIHRFNGALQTSRRPTFVWNKVAKAATYRIEISNNSLNINPYLTMLVSDTTYFPLGDLRTGVSYWRVSSDRNLSLFCMPDSLTFSAKTFSLKQNSRPSAYSCFVKRMAKNTFIDFELPTASTVSIALYSLQGKLLKGIAPSHKQPGYYEISLGTMELSRGYYVMDFKAGDFHYAKKLSNF